MVLYTLPGNQPRGDDDVAVFCTFIFAVLGKDNDPNGVTELESTDKVRCLSGVTKAKLKDSREVRNVS